MNGLDVLKETLAPARAADPLDELAAVAKRRTVDRTWQDVPIADMKVDPAYQRPPDREKIANFVKAIDDGEELPPGKANVRPDGSTWITDGQHRVAARAICGHKTAPMQLTAVAQQDEPQETGMIAKVTADQDQAVKELLAGAGGERVGKRLTVDLGPGRRVTYLGHDELVGESERGRLQLDGPDARWMVERLGLTGLV